MILPFLPSLSRSFSIFLVCHVTILWPLALRLHDEFYEIDSKFQISRWRFVFNQFSTFFPKKLSQVHMLVTTKDTESSYTAFCTWNLCIRPISQSMSSSKLQKFNSLAITYSKFLRQTSTFQDHGHPPTSKLNFMPAAPQRYYIFMFLLLHQTYRRLICAQKLTPTSGILTAAAIINV